jgi:hypothetical protein
LVFLPQLAWGGIEGEISEDMSMLMSFSTSESYVFIIYCLCPLLILVFQGYRAWEGFGYVHINANSGIGSIFHVLGGF